MAYALLALFVGALLCGLLMGAPERYTRHVPAALVIGAGLVLVAGGVIGLAVSAGGAGG